MCNTAMTSTHIWAAINFTLAKSTTEQDACFFLNISIGPAVS